MIFRDGSICYIDKIMEMPQMNKKYFFMSLSWSGQTNSSFLVMLYFSEHFHQKIRQHAIVIGGTTLHLSIYRTFYS